jgi:hypothetical protein
MLIRYSRTLQQMPPTVASTETYRRAYTEGFLLHMKLLVDFFYSDPVRDSVSALHYVANFRSLSVPAAKRGALEGYRAQAAKQLAHLSHWRTESTPPPTDWDMSGIMNDNLLPVIQDFVQRAPRNRIGPYLYGLRNAIFGFAGEPGTVPSTRGEGSRLSPAAIFLAVDAGIRK